MALRMSWVFFSSLAIYEIKKKNRTRFELKKAPLTATYDVGKGRGEESGHDGVDPDVVVSENGRQLAGQRVQGGFAHGVAKIVFVLKQIEMVLYNE